MTRLLRHPPLLFWTIIVVLLSAVCGWAIVSAPAPHHTPVLGLASRANSWPAAGAQVASPDATKEHTAILLVRLRAGQAITMASAGGLAQSAWARDTRSLLDDVVDDPSVSADPVLAGDVSRSKAALTVLTVKTEDDKISRRACLDAAGQLLTAMDEMAARTAPGLQ